MMIDVFKELIVAWPTFTIVPF